MNNSFSVLVTRPNPGGHELCQLLTMHGYTAIHFPTIIFLSPDNLNATQECLKHLEEQDWVIFISPQAVYASMEIDKSWLHLPEHVKFAAVGQGTADALKAAGLQVSAYPESEWNSEGLLALSAFKEIENKKIMLIRGQEGRELLAKTLQARGAEVTHLLTYKRGLPQIEINPYLNLLKRDKISVIVCASFTAVQHLKILLGEIGWPYLKNIPLIVVSERIKMLAQDLGFQTIWIARNASHAAIIEAIGQIKKSEEK